MTDEAAMTRFDVLQPGDTSQRTADECMARCLRDGAVILRFGAIDLDTFVGFTERFAVRFQTHNGVAFGYRKQLGDDSTVATVTLGSHPVGWHRETGYYPLSPHILFFFGRRPPRPGSGGETGLCDGVALWRALPKELASRLATESVEFTVCLDLAEPARRRALLQSLAATSLDEARGVLESMRLQCDERERFELEISEERFEMRYRTPLVRPAHPNAPDGICTYLLPDIPSASVLSDGSPFEPVRLELRRVADEIGYLHPWQSGDVIVVDNRRVMHMRRAFTDLERQIVIRTALLET